MKKKLLSAIIMILLSVCFFGFGTQTTHAKSAPVQLAKKKATLTITKTDDKTLYGTKKITVKKAKNITIKKITCKSKNKKIATVSSNKVTAKKKGATKITVTVKYKKKGKKKTYSKILTFKVKVVVNDKRTAASTGNGNTSTSGNNSNTSQPAAGGNTSNTAPGTGNNNSSTSASDWYSISDDANVITGTAFGTAVPSKSQGKYMATLNIGAVANGSYMTTGSNCVTAEVYSAFSYDNHDYYVIYIKTNDSNGYLYSEDNFKSLVSKTLSTSSYYTHILAVVFENPTKLYDGTSLFESLLDNFSSFIHLNYGGIYNLNYLDTSACTCFDRMFFEAYNSTKIDKINFYLPETFDTSNAVEMNYMFLNFGFDYKDSTFTLPESFDTSNVKEMSSIFSGTAATTLNLPEKFVIAKFNEGTSNASSAYVSQMFYASSIIHINAKTPLSLKYCEDSICFSKFATLDNQKSFVDSLDFSYLDSVSLSLYCNSNEDFIYYITDKFLTEATNLTSFSFMYDSILLDNFTLDLKNYPEINKFSYTFANADVETIILKNAVISDAEFMFDDIDCEVIDLSSCTFTSACDYDHMFYHCYRNDYELTIYVKDAAMQAKIIEIYNMDNPDDPITTDNVIIGSYEG